MEEQLIFKFQDRIAGDEVPELHWIGKQPYTSAKYYPAQRKEIYQDEEHTELISRIYLGDNLKIMGHLLDQYRGKVNLIYIDPPFHSQSDYKTQIKLRGKKDTASVYSFKEKQYSDIWTDGEYLQFMYERLILMRELLCDTGTIFLHCDCHMSMYLRCIMDEVFGPDCMKNEIIWHYEKWTAPSGGSFQKNHDSIFMYAKGKNTFHKIKEVTGNLKSKYKNGYLIGGGYGSKGLVVYDRTQAKVKQLIASGNYQVHYADMEGKPIGDVWNLPFINPQAKERTGYPTQKPEKLLERIITAATNESDLVMDCFMGSGTTLAAAMKLGRYFIGADCNPFAVQTAVKRLNLIRTTLTKERNKGFEVYQVSSSEETSDGKAETEIVREANKLKIRQFYSSVLLKKLNLQKESIRDWRQLVDAIYIDWNYDGSVLRPSTMDLPVKNELAAGEYDIPVDAVRIRIKIVDLLSESFEIDL